MTPFFVIALGTSLLDHGEGTVTFAVVPISTIWRVLHDTWVIERAQH